MINNIRKVFLLFLILILTTGIASATNDTQTDTSHKVSQNNPEHDITAAITKNDIKTTKTITKNTNTTNIKTEKETYETTADNYEELLDKISEAKKTSCENYTINLKAGTYTISQTINWDTWDGAETLIINGNNTILNGQNKTQLMNITVLKDVILNNVIITNCKADKGSAITSEGILTVNNSQFISNINGAISSDNGYLTVNNSQFINNTANEGGAISTWEGSMNILNALFKNNTAKKSGGSIYCTNTRLNINYSQFISNGADNGGAIYYDNFTYTDESYSQFTAYYPLNINNSQFINNIAATYGGAIYSNRESLNINNSQFINNTATTANSVYLFKKNLDSRNNNYTVNLSEEIKLNGGNLAINNNYFNEEKIAKCNITIYQIILNSLPSASIFGNNITISGYVLGDDYIVGEKVYITVNNETFTVKTDKNGKYSIKYTTKKTGKNSVSVTYEKTSEYDFNMVTGEFIVKKPASIILYNKTVTVEDKESTVSGKLLSNNKGIKGANIIITINGKKYTAKTYSSGYFTLKYTVPTGSKTYKITTSYAGSSTYPKAKNETTVYIKKESNIILYKVPVATKGNVSKISGKLLSNNKGIKGVNVTLDINGKKYYAKTYSSGYFTINYNVKTFDKITVKASFDNKYYLKSTNKTTFNVKQETKINILTKGKIVSGQTVKISGKLLLRNNKPVKKETVTITVGNNKFTAKTYSTGYFTVNHKFNSSKSKVTVKFTFAGSTNYLASSNSTTLTIVKT
ncbi:MAG: hypothetical protein BZ135_04850 [Methanosphaera sp. rholeuAM6]|nr:MAG: hypothetical protein BZ135_04850 [Methanosphaera sp. rholeuAM6]